MNQVISYFFIWRISLFLVAFLAVFIIPQFGAQFPYYQQLIATGLPSWIWGFGNFDGVHYLRIAQDGYSSEYSQAFFPVFPLLIKYLSVFVPHFYAGILISNLAFLVSLVVLYKLFLLDYDKKIVTRSFLLLMAFPTAFYFIAIYSESIFLLLTVSAIYLSRKERYLYAGIFAGVASATRLFGIFLFLIIFLEFLVNHKDQKKIVFEDLVKLSLGLFLSLTGITFYVFFLLYNYNNPFFFINAQPAFGAERSAGTLILLPQVFYRYLKILIDVPLNSMKYWTAVNELVFTSAVLGLLIHNFKKTRLSYLVFSAACLITPTLTGTLSSMPRYALSAFLLLPMLSQLSKRYFRVVLTIFIILQIILLILFTRGYWVA